MNSRRLAILLQPDHHVLGETSTFQSSARSPATFCLGLAMQSHATQVSLPRWRHTGSRVLGRIAASSNRAWNPYAGSPAVNFPGSRAARGGLDHFC
jgi:hypothetical protein